MNTQSQDKKLSKLGDSLEWQKADTHECIRSLPLVFDLARCALLVSLAATMGSQ